MNVSSYSNNQPKLVTVTDGSTCSNFKRRLLLSSSFAYKKLLCVERQAKFGTNESFNSVTL